MSSPLRLPDGTTVDLDRITHMSDGGKQRLIEAVLSRFHAEDADRYEGSPGYVIEMIEKITGYTPPGE